MCDVLEVSRSGFYAWKKRPPCDRTNRRRRLETEIRAAYRRGRNTYGSPRIHRELTRQGIACSRNTVAKYMRENKIQAIGRRKFKHTTDSNHRLPVAPNLLQRGFIQTEPNRVWTGDITYIPTREGWLYLATVEDLFSRRIVGWSMDRWIDRHLVIDALQMAIEQRRPDRGLIFHSDRGSQYASDDFRRLLAGQRIIQSMSRKGDCWDNAVMESFFGTLKTELVHHCDYATRYEARQSIFEYIEAFYNRTRIHSTLDYRSPIEYEASHAAGVAI
jgi:transposase InsO family protein